METENFNDHLSRVAEEKEGEREKEVVLDQTYVVSYRVEDGYSGNWKKSFETKTRKLKLITTLE